MARILGISAYYHDSAAALVVNGEIVAAAQEERFTRKKHDYAFPSNAINYCLKEAGLKVSEIDHVIFYDKPLLKFDRLLETYLAYAPVGLKSFMMAMPLWLKTKLHLNREISNALNGEFKKRIAYTTHHESHAASAFFPSPFQEAAVLTIDGVGEWETATIAKGVDNKIQMIKSLHFPHSLGLLYSAFTYFCGFRVNSGEYKLMGLAPYGQPRYTDLILKELMDLHEDGSICLRMEYFQYPAGLRMTNKKFADLFEGSERSPESPITQREMDLAASIQAVTEKVVLKMAAHAVEITGCRNLCLAGGVALNCVANGKLLRSGVVDGLFIQPAAGDAGGALGAALFAHYQLLGNTRIAKSGDMMKGSLLGPKYENDAIAVELDSLGAVYERYEDEQALLQRVAEEVKSDKVVGWFCGRMEFGPRALGSRSIIGDARSSSMQTTMNLRIKYRESFRPFAPVVLKEDVSHYFQHKEESPYMLIVADVKEEHWLPLSDAEKESMNDPDLRRRVNVARSTLPAVTHVDMSARIQTLDEERNGRFYRLVKEFKRQTGCGVMINTSFNVRGEPIVCTPSDAYRCLRATEMDVLVIENFVLRRVEQPVMSEFDKNRHVAAFDLD